MEAGYLPVQVFVLIAATYAPREGCRRFELLALDVAGGFHCPHH